MKRIIITITALLLIINTLAVAEGSQENYHARTAYPKLNYDSLFEVAQPLANSETGQALLKNCIEAYGGRSHLEALKSLRLNWHLKAMMKTDSINVFRSMGNNNQHRIDLTYASGGLSQRFLSGDTAWMSEKDSATVLDRNRTILENFGFLSMRLPLSINDKRFDKLKFGERRDDPLLYIYAMQNEKFLMVAGIDPVTFMVSKVEAIVIDQELRLVFVNLFSEISDESGYLIPHHFENISMGLKVGESNLVGAEINPTLADERFKPAN